MTNETMIGHGWMRGLAGALVTVALLAAAGAAEADGPGELKFDEESFEVVEENGVAVITVERSRGEDGTVSVDYSTSDGTATDGSDYIGVSGTFTWGDGDGGDRSFQIPILDDAEAEGAETIELTLSNPTGGAILDPERFTSVVIILASDGGTGNPPPPPPGGTDPDAGVLKFDERNFGAVEGNGVAVIVVERSHGEDGAVTVDYTASAGTATAGGDFTPVTGTLSWAHGDGGSKTFTVPLIDDEVAEGNETVMLALSNPTGGAGIDAERGTAVLNIFDDDAGTAPPPGNPNGAPGTIKFDETSFEFLEGGDAVIVVERSHGEDGEVSVDYTTIDGSAVAGSDYTAAAGTLTWAAGDDADKTFVVPLFEDGLSEGNETVQLVLSNVTGGAVIDPARGESTLVILDNDGSTLACMPNETTLCLANGRFQVEVDWRTRQGTNGPGRTIPLEGDRSGLVWFFDSTNVEMLVKVIDACQQFDRYWVFFSATTNVDYTVTVTDTATGIVRQYSNPLGRPAEPVQDTLTFATCD